MFDRVLHALLYALLNLKMFLLQEQNNPFNNDANEEIEPDTLQGLKEMGAFGLQVIHPSKTSPSPKLVGCNLIFSIFDFEQSSAVFMVNFEHIAHLVLVFLLLTLSKLLVFPFRRGGTRALSSACKTDQVDFTYWMSFLPYNIMEEINLNTEVRSANTLSLSSAQKS